MDIPTEPQCPECKGDDYRVLATHTEDGERKAYLQCEACGEEWSDDDV
jgi:DNA-directed RNA polymerase subunit M/transcription elongation factor TFIIS